MALAKPPSALALDQRSVTTVVTAAGAGRTTVIPHQVAPDAVGDGEALGRLAAGMPSSWTRGVDGAVDPVSSSRPAELGAVLPADRDAPTVTRIYHVQHTVRALTDSVFDGLEEMWPGGERWIERDAGFFVSSRGAVTPAHADRHHNLLLQLSGAKEIAVCVPGSRSHAAAVARSVPSFHVQKMPSGTEIVTLEAGSALYMPPYTVHWVRSTEDSVALSCGWSTDATVRAARVHFANATLRKLGLPARPVGSRHEPTRLRAAAGARRVRSLVAPAARRTVAR